MALLASLSIPSSFHYIMLPPQFRELISCCWKKISMNSVALKKYKFLINAGEGVEKGEPFYAVGRNVNCTTIIENSM